MPIRNAPSPPSAPAATTNAVFGEVLKHLRESADLTQAALAGAIPCDRSQVARVEAGTRVPDDKFAETCDKVLGSGGILLRLWYKIDWYQVVDHPDWFKRRAAMDAKATAVREYQTQYMPGLLQTESYARALFSLVATGKEAEERIHARLSRQHRFLAPNGPLLVAVLDESCLRNVVGSPEIMHTQYNHLLTVTTLPNIRIQVAPAAALGLLRPDTSMSLITLPNGQTKVYSESLDRGHFIEDPSAVAHHTQTYDVLRADALSAAESAALIRDFTEGHGHHVAPGPPDSSLDQVELQRNQRRQLRGNRPRFPRLRPGP
jgi:transcriptional regulator with XRE-family HTH domain